MSTMEQNNQNSMVLIVDDTPKNIQVIGSILMQQKYRISVAKNGREALKVVKDVKPDIILLDVMMPELDGFETCKQLKESPETRDIPVIFLTAKIETEDIVKAFELGAVDYVIKPFNAKELLIRVNTHLDLKFAHEKIKKSEQELRNVNAEIKAQHDKLARTLENLKRTQAQLIQSEKMASVGQLVAGIAHEINNPVTFISAGVDSLYTNLEEVRQILDIYHRITPNNAKEKLKEIEELKEQIDYKQAIREIDKLIESIKTGTERTTQIIKGLRTFSRLDEDVLKVADIHEGLDSTLILLRNKYKNRIEIAKDYGDIPQLECFPGQLNQVFMNILSNAIDAIEYKGIITISTSKSNGSIQINIKDTGRGIQENIKAKIFDPFFTTKEVGEGTGLGLSISHGIIEKHNGSIKVKSEAGKGSEFIILLPVRQGSSKW